LVLHFKNPTLYIPLLLLLLVIHEFYFNHLVDDAFISFRYAKNFVEGIGLTYNGGERVEGYTNFLWVIILSIPYLFQLQCEIAAKILGIFFSMAIVMLMYMQTIRNAGEKNFWCLMPVILLAANGSFALWALGGLETHLFTFLILLGSSLYIQNHRDTSSAKSYPFIFALSAMTRPEGLFVFATTILHKMTFERKKITIKEAGKDIFRFLIVFLPYFLWRFYYYGYPFPNSYYAKVANNWSQFLKGFEYVQIFYSSFGSIIFLLPILFILEYYKKFWTSYYLCLVGVYITYICYVGGDQLLLLRFFVPMLPFIYILFADSLKKSYFYMVEKWSNSLHRSLFLKAGSLLIFIFIVVCTIRPSFYGHEYERILLEKKVEKDRMIIGKWMKKNWPASTKIALVPAGIIPFYSEFYSIDLVGINDTHIAHAQVPDFGKGRYQGHQKYDCAYVLLKKPDYILLGPCQLYGNKFTSSKFIHFLSKFAYLAPVAAKMQLRKDFKRNYRLKKIHISPQKNFFVFKRTRD
jgi:hypothetical protein